MTIQNLKTKFITLEVMHEVLYPHKNLCKPCELSHSSLNSKSVFVSLIGLV